MAPKVQSSDLSMSEFVVLCFEYAVLVVTSVQDYVLLQLHVVAANPVNSDKKRSCVLFQV